MRAKQKQAIEAYHRVQDFLERHPPAATPGYVVQKAALDEVVARLDDHSVNHVGGRRMGRAKVSERRVLTKVLRERHLRPIAQIARATLAEAPGIDKALKMPGYRISALKLVTEADAMRHAASLYEQKFVTAGRPADFLERLDAATGAVRECVLGKARELGRQVGAGAGVAMQLQRARSVVDIIDTIVREGFYGDDQVLAEWRSAKRVRGVPGGAGATTVTAASADGSPEVTPLKLVRGVEDSASAMSV